MSSDASLKVESSAHDRSLPTIVSLAEIVKKLPSRLALGLIAFYKVCVSPFLGPACRYEPTCSSYASESLTRFGFLKGGWLATKRICRCHPLSNKSGFDPVPSVHTHVSLLKGSE
jgi:putative membrane protein insertion efficiency factor